MRGNSYFGPAQRRGGSANGKSARTIKISFLKIYTFDAAKTVRIVLAIQSHPVFGPGHQLIKKWLDLKIWGKASRFWNDSADEANAEVSRCSAKFKGSDLRFGAGKFLFFLLFEGAETVRINLAIQGHPVSEPGQGGNDCPFLILNLPCMTSWCAF